MSKSDAAALAELIELHAVPGTRILDCTYGRGRIWGKLPIRDTVIKTDINPNLPGLDRVTDWSRLLDFYTPWSVGVLVWDPIHVTDVGATSALYNAYTTTANPVTGASIKHLYTSFLDVAEQLVTPRTGIVLAKLADQVHNGRYRWQVFDFVAAATKRHWTACQRKIVPNPNLAPLRLKHQYHARNECAEWIVLRNGRSCRGPGRARTPDAE